MKQCIHCSAPIHEEASFCHACGQSQIDKISPKLPVRCPKKALVFCIVMIVLLLFAAGTLLYLQKEKIPVKVTWYDVNNVTGNRPTELHILVNGTDYNSSLILDEECNWTGKMPYNSDFSSGALSDKLDFDILDSSGKDIGYKEEISYENDVLYINLKYNSPFTVEWDDNDDAEGKRPESMYLVLQGKTHDGHDFRCRFGYFDNLDKTVPLEQGYIDGTAMVEVYTDSTMTVAIADYTPSLSYDEATCTITLTMSLVEEHERMPVQFVWRDTAAISHNRPDTVQLIIETTDSAYNHRATVAESSDWKLEIPWYDSLLNETYLKEEVRFTVRGENGQKIPYYIDAGYQDNTLFLYANYEIPFKVQWEDNDNAERKRPGSIYVFLEGDGFQTGITYDHPKTVPFRDGYVNSDVFVTVYDEYDREKMITDYIPTLKFNEKECSLTLIMNFVNK